MPLRLQSKSVAPIAPVKASAFFEIPSDLRGAAGQSFVEPKHNAYRIAKVKSGLVKDVIDWRVGG